MMGRKYHVDAKIEAHVHHFPCVCISTIEKQDKTEQQCYKWNFLNVTEVWTKKNG